ncbi:MAG: hypothetical protein ACYCYP_12260 [Leptospirales bacterium]
MNIPSSLLFGSSMKAIAHECLVTICFVESSLDGSTLSLARAYSAVCPYCRRASGRGMY